MSLTSRSLAAAKSPLGDDVAELAKKELRAIVAGSVEIRPQNSIQRGLHVRGHKNRRQAVSRCFRRKN